MVECTCGERFEPMREAWNDKGHFTWCPKCKKKLKVGDSYEYEKAQKKKET